MKRNLLKALPWINVYEGDDGAAEKAAAEKAAAEKLAAEKNKKTFNQDEVNSILAKEKRQTQQQMQQLTTELENLKKTSGLSEQEKSDLQARIDTLNNTYQTKEEQARKAQEKAEKEYKDKLANTEKERDTWQGRYAEENARNQIILSSTEEKAVSSKQMIDLLMPKTRLTEVVVDGKPTGKFETRVKLPGTDKEGKAIELDLAIKEAVKYLKDTPDEYGNLFKSDANPGLGAGNIGKGTGAIPKIPTSPEQYKRDREKYLAQ